MVRLDSWSAWYHWFMSCALDTDAMEVINNKVINYSYKITLSL